MAFCTSCGANVTGAFCNQCGTPARAQAPASPAGPPAAAPVLAQPPAGAVPAARKTSPIVWILLIVGGLFVLGIVGVVGTGFFLVHKAKQAGLDTDLMQRNPALAAAKLMVAANPDLSEVSHDDRAGTITVRDNKTGKVSTLNFEDIKNGRIKFSGTDEDGKTATVEFGATGSKLPSWIPEYPGSKSQATFAVKAGSSDGGEGGNFTFTTRDSASKVLSFYQDKAKELGMKVNLTTTGNEGGMIVASDETNERSLTIIIGESSGETTVNVTYGRKK
jgi:hypothetical protein